MNINLLDVRALENGEYEPSNIFGGINFLTITNKWGDNRRGSNVLSIEFGVYIDILDIENLLKGVDVLIFGPITRNDKPEFFTEEGIETVIAGVKKDILLKYSTAEQVELAISETPIRISSGANLNTRFIGTIKNKAITSIEGNTAQPLIIGTLENCVIAEITGNVIIGSIIDCKITKIIDGQARSAPSVIETVTIGGITGSTVLEGDIGRDLTGDSHSFGSIGLTKHNKVSVSIGLINISLPVTGAITNTRFESIASTEFEGEITKCYIGTIANSNFDSHGILISNVDLIEGSTSMIKFSGKVGTMKGHSKIIDVADASFGTISESANITNFIKSTITDKIDTVGTLVTSSEVLPAYTFSIEGEVTEVREELQTLNTNLSKLPGKTTISIPVEIKKPVDIQLSLPVYQEREPIVANTINGGGILKVDNYSGINIIDGATIGSINNTAISKIIGAVNLPEVCLRKGSPLVIDIPEVPAISVRTANKLPPPEGTKKRLYFLKFPDAGISTIADGYYDPKERYEDEYLGLYEAVLNIAIEFGFTDLWKFLEVCAVYYTGQTPYEPPVVATSRGLGNITAYVDSWITISSITGTGTIESIANGEGSISIQTIGGDININSTKVEDITTIKDRANVKSITGHPHVDTIRDNAVIGMFGNLESVTDDSRYPYLNDLRGKATIGTLIGRGFINYMYEDATVSAAMFSTLNTTDGVHMGVVRDDASIASISGNTHISTLRGKGKADIINGNAIVDVIYGIPKEFADNFSDGFTLDILGGNAKVYAIDGTINIKSFADNAYIGSLGDKSSINIMTSTGPATGSAMNIAIAELVENATITTLSTPATIDNLPKIRDNAKILNISGNKIEIEKPSGPDIDSLKSEAMSAAGLNASDIPDFLKPFFDYKKP